MENVYVNKEDCCGCTACSSICPANAITMNSDGCGFLYPEIDKNRCINCGACLKVCSFNKRVDNSKPKEIFAAKHLLMPVVEDSRSGGVFTALSDVVLELGGTVYGAQLDSSCFVRHVRTITKEERDTLRKSKYVQSDLRGVFDFVCDDLRDGKYVLFTGTACQCDGLKGFLNLKGVKTDRLIICDLVCHSNASPGLFRKYIRYQEEKHGSKIKAFYFRDKEKYSWWNHVEKIVFSDNSIYYTDEYTNLFFSNDIRPSCFKCKYTSLCRCSDITIADCWGGEKRYPDLVNRQGASLVFVNTEKGASLFKTASKYLDARTIDISYVMQPRLKEPAKKEITYDLFWNDYQNLDFNVFMEKYTKNNYSVKNRFIKKLVFILKSPSRKIRRIIRRFQ